MSEEQKPLRSHDLEQDRPKRPKPDDEVRSTADPDEPPPPPGEPDPL